MEVKDICIDSLFLHFTYIIYKKIERKNHLLSTQSRFGHCKKYFDSSTEVNVVWTFYHVHKNLYFFPQIVSFFNHCIDCTLKLM